MDRRRVCDLSGCAPEWDRGPSGFQRAPSAAAGTRTFNVKPVDLRPGDCRRSALFRKQKRHIEHLAPGTPFRQRLIRPRCDKQWERQRRVAVFEYDSQCVFIAGLAWHQPQRDAVESCDRHIEGHAHAAQGAPHDNAFAMEFDIAHLPVGSRVAGKKPHRQAGRVEP